MIIQSVALSFAATAPGGSFLLVPIMLVVLKIPTRMTIASSLAITFISSIGSTIGKISTEQVEYGPAFIMIVASLVASPLGAEVGKRVNTKVLQIILALLILATAVKTWIEIL
ncbi:sulfite exporter TauE/SafE family protein [Sporosarcina sp. Marseille-Q4063]|uniref:sulfite exporter TauE/SafE family protein n=1 Tax=Sporosarcina sp. Marseille-Q4063 TaxID=2810514 RepID=UPI0021113389|nr:sulfite exporter TauE/SafE family protein [Sporosarcina sp. Marseille-Q4063]